MFTLCGTKTGITLQTKYAVIFFCIWFVDCSYYCDFVQMFGREAAKWLDYVECFPDGYKTGIKIAKACSDVKIEGFPTWVINGQVRSIFWHSCFHVKHILVSQI